MTTPQSGILPHSADEAAKRAGFRLESWMTNPPKPAMWHGTPEAGSTDYRVEGGFL
jgi:hypothetical protein